MNSVIRERKRSRPVDSIATKDDEQVRKFSSNSYYQVIKKVLNHLNCIIYYRLCIYCCNVVSMLKNL